MAGSIRMYAARSRFIPATRSASSTLAARSRAAVSVPSTRTAAADPIATTRNAVPSPNSCSTTAAATSDAEVRTAYTVIRWRTSDQVRCRVASRLQCSVTRSWT
jgi:hypothetical protein